MRRYWPASTRATSRTAAAWRFASRRCRYAWPLLTAAARAVGTAGRARRGNGELAGIFAELARVVAEEVAPVIETSGCTARLLDQMAEAVSAEPVVAPPGV